MKHFEDFSITIPPGATGEVDTTCPECSPKRKKHYARCLSVNVDKGVWNCAHCGWSGSLQQGSDPRREPPWRKPEYRRPVDRPASPISQRATAWFSARGISLATLTRNRISTESVYMPQLEETIEAIVFPYYRDGELVNRKYRDYLDERKNFRMEAGAERILYGLNDMAPDRLVVVEGEIDKLSIEEAGFTNCVSVPDGAPVPGAKDYASKFSFLESAKEVLDQIGEFVLAVDNDAPGKALEDELARRFKRAKCRRVAWPEGCKDANDTLVKHGAETVRYCIENSEPFPITGAFEVLDQGADIRRLFEQGFERGHSTGWRTIDEHYTVRPGEFTVVTGIPSSGKSNWIDALLVNLARLHGWGFALFSPENQPLEDHMSRMIEKYVRLPFSEGPTPRMTPAMLEGGMRWAHEHFRWILPPDDRDWSIEFILDTAQQLLFRHGIRGLVIDPWNELEDLRDRSESETEYVSRALKKIRQFARQCGIHVWIVVHPQKLYRAKEDGKYPVPTLYDCSGSAHWRNKADNGIVVWRDLSVDDTPEVTICVQKIRFRQVGRRGSPVLRYDRVCATYSDPSDPNDPSLFRANA